MRTTRNLAWSVPLQRPSCLFEWMGVLGVTAVLLLPASGRCEYQTEKIKSTGVASDVAGQETEVATQPVEVRGTVLKSGSRGWALVDIGSDRGLAMGDVLQVHNVVEVKHPVTGQTIRDELPLGGGAVVRVGKNVAWIEVRPLTRDLHVKVGDVVVFEGKTVAEDAVAETKTGAEAVGGGGQNWDMGDRDESAGDWNMGAGVEVNERSQEVATSSRTRSNRRGYNSYRYGYHGAGIVPERYSQQRKPRHNRVAHDPISKVEEGQDLFFSVALDSRNKMKSVRVMARVGNNGNFRKYKMKTVGDTAWEVAVPSSEIKTGTLEYFIEGEDESGSRYEIFRSQRRPWRVGITGRPGSSVSLRTTLHASYEWQEFYLNKPNRDAFWRAEIDFAYDLESRFLRNIRVGFGGLEGTGERNYNLEADQERATHYRAIAYGFFQPEFHFGQWVRFAPRLSIGAVGAFDNSEMRDVESRGDPDYRIFTRGEPIAGVAVRLNFGKEEGLNFTVGGGYMMTVGVETMVGFSIDAFPGVPVGATATVTNLPVEEDWAGQVMMNFGWNGLEWLSLEGKFGFSIRNIHHAGLGGGLSVAFHW